MAYVEPKAPGFRYGLGAIAADAVAGQCVRLTDANVFSVNDDAAKRSFGILAAACAKDALCGVYCMGGIYETDQLSGNIAAGDLLGCDAQTIAKLADYLWWLLPAFLKKKERTASLMARFCDVWGGILDTARTTLVDIIPQLLVETASGEYLDMLARARQIFRGEGETDESLRIRVLAAHEIKRKGGTIPGMVAGLAAMGYTVEVEEPNKGNPAKWSRFLVKVFQWTGVVADQKVFYLVVRLLKPAHTRALIESLLPPETYDDWEPLEQPKTFDDGGQLDSWLPTA